MMGSSAPTDHLEWKTVAVEGGRVNYGVAGDGLPVVFIHGWALGQHAYKRALKRLVRLGCRVYAPAMPGFGGSTRLSGDRFTIEGYAERIKAFLDAVGVNEPAFVVGHSFGGAVATKLAHEFPERVGYLVLINAVGGGAWLQAGNKVRSMAERPIWDWAVHFPWDTVMGRGLVSTTRAIVEDAVPNLLREPCVLIRVALLARSADLTGDLADLREWHLPVLVLWGEGDSIIPKASFDALCAALGSSGTVVPGRHSWLLADPDSFGEVMANAVAVARTARASGSERVVAFPVAAD
jgi:pimeloyl-ACP methyl ester carboxylesterase